VRSIDIALGRGPWSDQDAAAGAADLDSTSSPAWMRIGKQRRSAFADTRLGLLLRTNEVRHVTVAGADAVPGAVAATILDALDADYAVTVAADACMGFGWSELEAAGLRVADSAEIGARWQARRAQTRAA
jgi:nicotinamidase-related amidase